MTEKKFTIEGMTCGNCVATVKSGIESIEDVENVQVQLESPQVTLTENKTIALTKYQRALGKYKISEYQSEKEEIITEDIAEVSFTTYRPLIIIISFILGVTVLAQYPLNDFDGMLWMRHFMAGFFIVFSFFKLLNLSGFASSYSMYDIIAGKWYNWGYIYPFVELGLGIVYLIGIMPFWVNVATIIVLGISSIGVIQSNLNKRKIKCACLGDVFNLPMSTVTIIEDLTMVLMAIGMLLYI